MFDKGHSGDKGEYTLKKEEAAVKEISSESIFAAHVDKDRV